MRLYAHADRLGMPRVGALVDGELITGGQLAKFEPRDTPWSQTVYFPCNQVTVPGWRDAFERTVRRAVKAKATRRSPDSRRPLPAVWLPEKIVGIGLNYADHAREGGREVPKRPLMFAKFANAIIADGESIVQPEGTHALDLEVELGVVIARRTRRVAPEVAMAHVAGYVVVNDVSARDWQGNPQALAEGQKGDGQWLRAKSSDTFLPVGPILVTPDEVDPAAGLRLRSWIIRDGEEILMQDGNTRDLIVDVPHLVSLASQEITLEPGDLLITGTPAGVGVFRDPPVFLRPGDRVRCEVEGVGSVENPIVDWSEDPRHGV
jgi:2-keto-4-pentenoate hydratase/2-oxohepta-3-ene-1,7-dioic acid hydratase in catechol pathway